MTAGDRQVLNIATGAAISVNDLYTEMAAAAGSALAPRRGASRLGDVRSSRLDAQAALATLGWAPKVTLQAGLRSLFDSLP